MSSSCISCSFIWGRGLNGRSTRAEPGLALPGALSGQMQGLWVPVWVCAGLWAGFWTLPVHASPVSAHAHGRLHTLVPSLSSSVFFLVTIFFKGLLSLCDLLWLLWPSLPLHAHGPYRVCPARPSRRPGLQRLGHGSHSWPSEPCLQWTLTQRPEPPLLGGEQNLF